MEPNNIQVKYGICGIMVKLWGICYQFDAGTNLQVSREIREYAGYIWWQIYNNW